VFQNNILVLYIDRYRRNIHNICVAAMLAERGHTMNIRIRELRVITAAFSLLIFSFTGYGCSNGDVLSLEDIPPYPGATRVESMDHSGLGGIMGGVLVQFITTDPYDEVVSFYTDELTKYDPESVSHESVLGRQTALVITKKNGGVSVAIQEFTKEGQVSITFMQVKG
jgi:hypothetical protein